MRGAGKTAEMGRRRGRAVVGGMLLAWALAAMLPGWARAQAAKADLRSIRIDGAITTVSLDYVERALDLAESEGADGVLIELDTPGGSVEAMLAIGGRMLNAKLPILVWVGPQGAQAASAGTFIVLAGHTAGMAPRTTIGAASPVGPVARTCPRRSAASSPRIFRPRPATTPSGAASPPWNGPSWRCAKRQAPRPRRPWTWV